MLPLILKRLGADPAASSTPFVATLVDVTGLIIYFSMAFAFAVEMLNLRMRTKAAKKDPVELHQPYR